VVLEHVWKKMQLYFSKARAIAGFSCAKKTLHYSWERSNLLKCSYHTYHQKSRSASGKRGTVLGANLTRPVVDGVMVRVIGIRLGLQFSKR
jgi:hypothetical protein